MREIKTIEENLNRRLQELNENNFRLFLNNLRQEQGKNKGKPYTKKTKDNYINKLKKIKKDIFSISNPFDILEIIYAIKNQEIEYDGTYSTTSALKHYLNFLEANLLIKKLHRNNMNIKNIILYGSPGVGKTHNTNKLISLIESRKSEKEIFETIKKNEQNYGTNIDYIKDRIKFVTFHQSFGYEDFIEGFRPNEEGNIELVDGVFKNICTIAQKNLDDSVKEKGLDVERLLNDFTRYIEEQEDFEIDENITIKVKKKSNGELQSFVTKGRVKNQNLTKDIIIRDLQDYFDGKITDYKDIKPTYESKSSYHGNAPYYYKLYAKIKDFSNDKEEYKIEKVEQQNYYLVIDEINRGNISKIFGELITLLEEDKRDKLEVTLPYSKKPFKIPSNLYVIGTMNSTDKSIALIDIALRRRFTFLKMKPNAELIEHLEAKRIFIALNQQITNDLGEDYQIGHSYFMGIKDDNDLDFILEYKIKPLLEEYFYGDKDGLEKVLKIVYKKEYVNEDLQEPINGDDLND